MPIRADTIATVVTDDLRIRSRPGTGSEILPPRLDTGRNLFVIDGPLSASGYRWWHVQTLGNGRAIDGAGGWLGWVAEAGLDGERWIEADRFECPARPRTFAAFRTLEPLVAVACETGKIRFEARLGRPEATCGADPGWTIEPEWLGSPCPHPPFFLADPYEASGDMLFDLAWSPRLDATGLNPGVEPQDFLNVYVTGRYDHAAARSCHAVSNDVPVPDLQPGEVVLRCRAMFVVTKLEPIVP